VKKAATEEKKRYCSAGSHWTTSEFLKIGPVRFICVACNKRRKAELRKPARQQTAGRGRKLEAVGLFGLQPDRLGQVPHGVDFAPEVRREFFGVLPMVVSPRCPVWRRPRAA